MFNDIYISHNRIYISCKVQYGSTCSWSAQNRATAPWRSCAEIGRETRTSQHGQFARRKMMGWMETKIRHIWFVGHMKMMYWYCNDFFMPYNILFTHMSRCSQLRRVTWDSLLFRLFALFYLVWCHYAAVLFCVVIVFVVVVHVESNSWWFSHPQSSNIRDPHALFWREISWAADSHATCSWQSRLFGNEGNHTKWNTGSTSMLSVGSKPWWQLAKWYNYPNESMFGGISTMVYMCAITWTLRKHRNRTWDLLTSVQEKTP